MRSKNIKLKLQIIDLIQRNEVLKSALDSRESKDVEKTEGFLNFVTQSRDWAFEYIENEVEAEEDMPIFTIGFTTDRGDVPEKVLNHLVKNGYRAKKSGG